MFLTENANNAENSAAEQQTAARSFLPFKPLNPSADSLPSFPIDCLPSRLRSYVEAVAIHTQTPVDMAAGTALGVLATCLQGKVKVEGNIGHYEQTSLYIFLIAPPGSRKSAVIHAMTAAIEDYEQKYNEENKAAMRRNRQERESLQRDINRLTRQLEAKYDKLTELELQHTQDKLAELPAIKPLQIFTDDCTSESMIRLLRDNHGRMALMAELFQRDKSTISRHIKNVFVEGELDRNAVVAKFATTAADGKTYQVEFYKSRMKAYAEFNDYEIVGEYEDAGKSGKSIEGRIEFNHMMEDIKSGKRIMISTLRS